MDRYLPIGTVVLLKDSTKRVMIFGRKQIEVKTGREWDYVACLFPEGRIDQEHNYLFNSDQIEQVYFVGYQDIEEFVFRENFLK